MWIPQYSLPLNTIEEHPPSQPTIFLCSANLKSKTKVWDQVGSIHEKKQEQKIWRYSPFKVQ
jgi:hypothetical protein